MKKLFVTALAGGLLLALTLVAAAGNETGSNGAGGSETGSNGGGSNGDGSSETGSNETDRFSLEDRLTEGFPRDNGLVSYSFAEDDCSQYLVVQYDPDKTESIQFTITSLDLASTATYAMDEEGGLFTATSTEMGRSFSSFGSPGRMQLEVSAEEMGYEIELALEAHDGEKVEEKLRMYFDELQPENCADEEQR